jgi:predicted dehydrogenase
MKRKTRYAQVGLGGRHEMFRDAVTVNYKDTCEMVALCDINEGRLRLSQGEIKKKTGVDVPGYADKDFDRMIAERKPDCVIVTTKDCWHDTYICRAMELGCDAITEKPMTMDAKKCQRILDTQKKTGRKCTVTFNYRYSPPRTQIKDMLMSGVIGEVLSVDFHWLLDTSHGADYFRRWHREKQNSGGLIVHKATHHFDLVNWWVDSYPREVFALGSLAFYGQRNAEARGEHYPYARYTGEPEAQNDPFALFLDQDDKLKALYLDAEAEDGYLRDRNVFGEPITIEDTMAVTARYRNGVILSYCLIAYSPWEGLRVAINGTRGRAELEVIETTAWLKGQNGHAAHDPAASTGAFRHARIRVFPMFDDGYEVPIPGSEGGHGGADPVLLEQLFSPAPPPDPYQRAASHIDGAASILTGIAANRSMETGQMIRLDDLLVLPDKPPSGGPPASR